MTDVSSDLVVIFQSTSDALMAEQSLKHACLPGRLIPAPRHLSYGCGLAWLTAQRWSEQVHQVLQAAQITGDIHML